MTTASNEVLETPHAGHAIQREAGSRARPQDYRSVLSFDPGRVGSPGAVELALEQASAWLRGKHPAADLDLARSGSHRVDDAIDVLVVHHHHARLDAVRLRLSERTSRGTWTTTLEVTSPASGRGWVSLRVSNNQGLVAARPNLASALLEVLDLRDGEYVDHPGTPIVTTEGVEDLAEAVCDPDRSGLLFVAASDPDDPSSFRDFRERATKWFSRTDGLAIAVILEPPATKAFNEIVGDTHSVNPGGVRTYRPGADPAIEGDARRHRFLGERRLADSSDIQIRNILTDAARIHSAAAKPPAEVLAASRALTRAEDRLLFGDQATASMPAEVRAFDEAPTVTPQITPDESAVEEVRATPFIPYARVPEATDGATDMVGIARLLNVGELTEAAVSQALARLAADTEARVRKQLAKELEQAQEARKAATERQEWIEFLEDSLQNEESARQEAEFDRAAADEERLKVSDRLLASQDEVRRLRAHVVSPEAMELVYSVAAHAPLVVPGSFSDLIDECLGSLSDLGVHFTGKKAEMETARGLDDHDSNGNLVQVAWECLVVLSEYARAKREDACSTGLKQYLQQPPDGYRSMPLNKFGERESKDTRNNYLEERTLPVPDHVDPSGYAVMEAHWKLPRHGMITPRIHFLDNTHADGCVYVGYIGPHLRTKES